MTPSSLQQIIANFSESICAYIKVKGRVILLQTTKLTLERALRIDEYHRNTNWVGSKIILSMCLKKHRYKEYRPVGALILPL